MNKSWKVNVWGVRGSAPAPLMKYMEYGGNTTCISIERENHMVIFDAGTGLTVLGSKLNQQEHMRLDIIITHLHIDHVIGLFLFQPFFSSNMEICLHGGIGLEQHLKQLISSPWWPIGIQDFKAKRLRKSKEEYTFNLLACYLATETDNDKVEDEIKAFMKSFLFNNDTWIDKLAALIHKISKDCYALEYLGLLKQAFRDARSE